MGQSFRMLASQLVEESKALTKGHFVYKSGNHGDQYLNKEMFIGLGAEKMAFLLRAMVDHAYYSGIALGSNCNLVGIVGPAMGAIPYALTVAEESQKLFSHRKIRFFPARTELEVIGGKKVHVLPPKLAEIYRGAQFIIAEDIVNAGTTIGEVAGLYEREFGQGSVIGAMSLIDRGDQTAKSLGIGQYFPLLRRKMEQYHPSECLLCKAGIPIDTALGKGKGFVEKFGQPPYDPK